MDAASALDGEVARCQSLRLVVGGLDEAAGFGIAIPLGSRGANLCGLIEATYTGPPAPGRLQWGAALDGEVARCRSLRLVVGGLDEAAGIGIAIPLGSRGANLCGLGEATYTGPSTPGRLQWGAALDGKVARRQSLRLVVGGLDEAAGIGVAIPFGSRGANLCGLSEATYTGPSTPGRLQWGAALDGEVARRQSLRLVVGGLDEAAGFGIAIPLGSRGANLCGLSEATYTGPSTPGRLQWGAALDGEVARCRSLRLDVGGLDEAAGIGVAIPFGSRGANLCGLSEATYTRPSAVGCRVGRRGCSMPISAARCRWPR